MPPYDFQPTAYRARLWHAGDRQPVRDLEDRWYLLDLDLRPGPYMEESSRRLFAAWKRLLTIAGVTRDLEYYQLQVRTHDEVERDQFWWVPTRPEEEYGPWR